MCRSERLRVGSRLHRIGSLRTALTTSERAQVALYHLPTMPWRECATQTGVLMASGIVRSEGTVSPRPLTADRWAASPNLQGWGRIPLPRGAISRHLTKPCATRTKRGVSLCLGRVSQTLEKLSRLCIPRNPQHTPPGGTNPHPSFGGEPPPEAPRRRAGKVPSTLTFQLTRPIAPGHGRRGS